MASLERAVLTWGDDASRENRGRPRDLEFTPNIPGHLGCFPLHEGNKEGVEGFVIHSNHEAVGFRTGGARPCPEPFSGEIQTPEKESRNVFRRDSGGDTRDDDGDEGEVTRVVKDDWSLQDVRSPLKISKKISRDMITVFGVVAVEEESVVVELGCNLLCLMGVSKESLGAGGDVGGNSIGKTENSMELS